MQKKGIEVREDINNCLFEDYYEVSNMGRVRSKGRVIMRASKSGTLYKYYMQGRILKYDIKKSKGTAQLRIMTYGDSRKTFYVARLVYATFNNVDYDTIRQVHFIDGNPFNCKLSNLFLTGDECFVFSKKPTPFILTEIMGETEKIKLKMPEICEGSMLLVTEEGYKLHGPSGDLIKMLAAMYLVVHNETEGEKSDPLNLKDFQEVIMDAVGVIIDGMQI